MPRSHKPNIRIGLVNNMPDGAFESTERQFQSLLHRAAGDHFAVHLSLYEMPDIARSGEAAERSRELYSSVEALWESIESIDGLIVTGREPLAESLEDEPYWNTFGRLHTWATEHTHSTIWSCLAAHAAVLHDDGIQRTKRAQKLSGVYDCERISSHTLTEMLPARLGVPHSRWNGVSERALQRNGYQVLSRSVEAGADLFIKRHKSLFVYFQGHPEYDPKTLMLEYRRDVARYLQGGAATYPATPRGYFDRRTDMELERLRQRSNITAREDLLQDLSEVLASAETNAPWKSIATRIYRNWLYYIQSKREACSCGSLRDAEHEPQVKATFASLAGKTVRPHA